jgi:selenocysteine-specific elongation factor
VTPPREPFAPAASKIGATRQIVVGTAGHIDHGKSRLVQALTGIDPDRLKEEKERGITIDLGFADLVLPDGSRAGFVDVPGHERFVKNMLAGVGGIDLVLLVIAADESIKPQTREHFDICRLLRIPLGLIVLTKADLVDSDILDLVRLEVREFVAGSFLESAPIVAVSSRTGAGLSELKEELAALVPRVPQRPVRGVVRLPIDRSFSVKGFGAVVTGTLISGSLREGDEVAILPQGTIARVRGLEVFNTGTPVAQPGQRTAVNLQGVDPGAIERGNLLTAPHVLSPSHLLDVSVEVLPDSGSPLKNLARVRFHHGTLEAMARVRLLDGAAVPPGGQAFAQLRLEAPVTALPGDRFILRRYSPSTTIAGGAILHNAPAKLRRSAPGARERFQRLADPSPAERLRILVEESAEQGIEPAVLRARTGLDPDAIEALLEPVVRSGAVTVLKATPPRYLSGAARGELTRRVLGALDAFHRKEPLQEGIPKEELRARLFARSHADVFRCFLAELAEQGLVRIDRDRIALATHTIALSPPEAALLERIESAFALAGTNPPDLKEVAAQLKSDVRQVEKLLHLLLNLGRIVRIQDGKLFHRRALEDLKKRLWRQRASNPVIEIGAFKDLSGTSRKNAIPLLEHLDTMRITRREGNRRVILPPPDGAN